MSKRRIPDFTIGHDGWDKLQEVLQQARAADDMLHAIDLIGDGIGGKNGFAISEVAQQAKLSTEAVVDSLECMIRYRDILKAGGGSDAR